MNQERLPDSLPRGQCGLASSPGLTFQADLDQGCDGPKRSESSGGLEWTLCPRDNKLTERFC